MFGIIFCLRSHVVLLFDRRLTRNNDKNYLQYQIVLYLMQNYLTNLIEEKLRIDYLQYIFGNLILLCLLKLVDSNDPPIDKFDIYC